MKAKVWDAVNESEECAKTLTLDGTFRGGDDDDLAAETLAEKYAENDVDGNTDEIYVGGHPIIVLFESGRRYRVTVSVDYDPTFHGKAEIEPR